MTVPSSRTRSGFLDCGDSLLTYNQTEAKRLANLRRHPPVSLHFDSNGGVDIVVFTGIAEILDDYPAVPAAAGTHSAIDTGSPKSPELSH